MTKIKNAWTYYKEARWFGLTEEPIKSENC
jgi:hypothetical protein